MPTILCIDDNVASVNIRKMLLEMQGYSVLTANDGITGLPLLSENLVDVVVLDYSMPDMDGLDVATAIREQGDRVPILLLTGHPKDVPDELVNMVDAVVIKGQPVELFLNELRRLCRGVQERKAG